MAPSSGSQSNMPGSIPTRLSRLLSKSSLLFPDIMNKVQLFQDRILTDAEQLALATGAAAFRWEDLTKAPVSPSMLLNPRRYGDGAKDLWTTLNCVQENIIRGGQRDRSRRRPDGSRMPKSRAIKGIDEDMKLNKALWEMAEVLRNSGAQ